MTTKTGCNSAEYTYVVSNVLLVGSLSRRSEPLALVVIGPLIDWDGGGWIVDKGRCRVVEGEL